LDNPHFENKKVLKKSLDQGVTMLKLIERHSFYWAYDNSPFNRSANDLICFFGWTSGENYAIFSHIKCVKKMGLIYSPPTAYASLFMNNILTDRYQTHSCSLRRSSVYPTTRKIISSRVIEHSATLRLIAEQP
jgi:hypothetical protein